MAGQFFTQLPPVVLRNSCVAERTSELPVWVFAQTANAGFRLHKRANSSIAKLNHCDNLLQQVVAIATYKAVGCNSYVKWAVKCTLFARCRFKYVANSNVLRHKCPQSRIGALTGQSGNHSCNDAWIKHKHPNLHVSHGQLVYLVNFQTVRYDSH